jgi:hypothetical protein
MRHRRMKGRRVHSKTIWLCTPAGVAGKSPITMNAPASLLLIFLTEPNSRYGDPAGLKQRLNEKLFKQM